MTINFLGRQILIRKSMLIPAILAAVVIMGSIGLLITRSGREIIIEKGRTQAAGTFESGRAASAEKNPRKLPTSGGEAADASSVAGLQKGDEPDEIKIYIVGCVKKPGVISLKKGRLIDDAVKAAGGLTPDADPLSVNMVYKLEDNLMLYIHSKKELASAKNQQTEQSEAGRGVKIVRDSGGAVVNEKKTPETEKGGKIDLNTASEAELDTLPGIGEATAREIIAYREKNGPFKRPKDIMKIPRIKEARYNAIKDLVTVD